MARGYVYTVATVESDYFQPNPRAVPVWNEALNCLIFGPCKVPIRRRLQVGDYLFGVSPSGTRPRRILFAARIAEKVKYHEAYVQWPALRGPDGPIHVEPVERPGLPYPASAYAFIPGSIHGDRWERDLATPDLDAFFLCEPAEAVLGRWLGPAGPVVEGPVLDFLRGCSVHGQVGLLSQTNASATEGAPIRHGNLFTGLHLETDEPESLVRLCGAGDDPVRSYRVPTARPGRSTLPSPARSASAGPAAGIRGRTGGCGR